MSPGSQSYEALHPHASAGDKPQHGDETHSREAENMKNLLIAILVIAVMILAGWITYDYTTDRTTFSIETRKVKQDADRAIDDASRAFDIKIEKKE